MRVPVLDGQLTGDDGGSAAMAIVDDLQQIAPLLCGEWGQAPVVEDENLGTGEALEHACITSVAGARTRPSSMRGTR